MATHEGSDIVAPSKGGTSFVEDVAARDLEKTASRTATLAVDPSRRADIEKRLKLKLDARNSIFLLIYIMNYLDRNNIAAARLGGLQDDLDLNNDEYATCLGILYLGYVLTQIPSNIIVNRLARPSWYIATAMLVWGLISTLTGLVQNFPGMVMIRFFLGIVEAVFLPAALLILSKWYTRRELTMRNAILFCGVMGHESWRWLFFIEGECHHHGHCHCCWLHSADLPHNSRGFTEDELRVAQLRMIEDVGEVDSDSAEDGIFSGLVMAFKDWKIWLMVLGSFLFVMGLTFNAYFPTLTQTLGYSYVPTLLMSAPPWIFSALVSLFNGWHADKTQERFWHITVPLLGGMTGFTISMITLNTAARYVSLFLQASSYAGWIVLFSWVSSSFPRPPAKRAVAIAMVNSFCQLANLAGSYIWNLDENGYRKSYGIILSMFGAAIVCFYIFRLQLIKANKKLEAGEAAWALRADVTEKTAELENMETKEDVVLMRKGFRFLL
ncbi:major facilitator superfamily transporter [Stachybotrys elegans]|uniref:Major facilitator superfamily transporter n=1 Tax=Stachybotrys elegans TaxID=80388 RepID=A0A8K0WMT8_9HYPO|nr:major facilitator superfamily transporter [Stachybotrys elegans]